MELLYTFDKYAAAAIREGHVAGHFKKGASEKFAKTIISTSLKKGNNSRCWIEVTGKRCNLSDEEGKKVPCWLKIKERKATLIYHKIYHQKYENLPSSL